MNKSLDFKTSFCCFGSETFINCIASMYVHLEGIGERMAKKCGNRNDGICGACNIFQLFYIFDFYQTQFKKTPVIFSYTSPLTFEETRIYVEYRLKEARASSPIFGEKCYPALYHLTGGIFRMIDQACYQALSTAYFN